MPVNGKAKPTYTVKTVGIDQVLLAMDEVVNTMIAMGEENNELRRKNMVALCLLSVTKIFDCGEPLTQQEAEDWLKAAEEHDKGG